MAATLERLERIDVSVVVVARPDGNRQRAIQKARDAAIAAGRGELLNEATATARDLAIRAFARRGFTGTWAMTEWSVSTSGAGDRVAVADAFEESATAAVAEDLLDEETLATLRATSDELAMMTGVPEPGALSTLGLGGSRSGLAAVIFLAVAAFAGLAVGSVTGLILGFGMGLLLLVLFARRSS